MTGAADVTAGPQAGWPRGSAAGPTGGGRTPDFFIVGQPKSGTTALHDMLRRHPQVFMPASKEPWFFAEELHLRPPPRPDGIPETLQEYCALFDAAGPDQRVGEASPLYLWSRTAAAGIAAVRPDARIIAILREPASLLRSLHLQFVQTYVEDEADFRSAMELEGSRREGRNLSRHTYWPLALQYSDHVHYVEHLARYRAAFSAEQMLVLIYDDFRRDNAAIVREVLRFVEVDDASPIEMIEANPTVGVRSQRLHELVHAVAVGRGPVSRGVKAAIKAASPRGFRRDALYAAQRRLMRAEPPPPDEGFMEELRCRFRGEVEALSEYLDRDLIQLWGYDRVA